MRNISLSQSTLRKTCPLMKTFLGKICPFLKNPFWKNTSMLKKSSLCGCLFPLLGVSFLFGVLVSFSGCYPRDGGLHEARALGPGPGPGARALGPWRPKADFLIYAMGWYVLLFFSWISGPKPC